MPVDSMTIRVRRIPGRKSPQAGDTKTDKDGVVWVRHAKVVRAFDRVLGLDCTGGRQRYVWIRQGESYP